MSPKVTPLAALTSLTFIISVLISGPGTHAFQIRQDKTPLDERAVVDPVATLNGDSIALDSLAAVDSKRLAWGQFQTKAAGSWKVYLDNRSGAPMLVEGSGIPWPAPAGKGLAATPADYEASVRQFLAENRGILIADDSELVLSPDATVAMTPSVKQIAFDHYVHGIQVLGDRYVFLIGQGNLVAFGATRWTPIEISPVPAVTADEALGRLLGHMAIDTKGGLKVVDPATLYYIPVPREGAVPGRGYGSALVWKMALLVEGHPGTWVGYVDANDGSIRGFYDDDKYAQVKGGVLPESPDGICPSGCEQPNYPMPYADLNVGGSPSTAGHSGIFTCAPGGATATTTLAGPFVRIADVCGAITRSVSCDADIDLGINSGTNCTVPAGASPGDTKAARTGFYTLNRIKEHAKVWFPAGTGLTWLNSQLVENTNVNNVCNATWGGGQINMYRAGSGCNNTGEIAGVVVHEWGHGMDQNDGGGFDNPSEAYGDVSEFLYDRTSCIGRGFEASQCGGYGNPCTSCTGIRDMDWAKRVNNTPSTPAGFIATCPGGSGPCGKEVHCEGYLSGETIWDLAARDLPAAGFDAETAWQITDRLWYRSRPGSGGNAYACSGTTGNSCAATSWFAKMRVADDDDGNLANGTPHAAAIFAAFNRHGIACGAAGDASNQNSSSCPVLVAPSVTTSASTNSVIINWTSVPGAASYRIYRNEISCTHSSNIVAVVPAPTTNYTDTGLANGFSVNYRVQAVANGSVAADVCDGAVSACKTATPQPFAGSVVLDKAAYACSAPIVITVSDGNIGASTTTVAIRSNTESTPEVVTLNNVPAGSASYTGTISTTSGAAAPDGLLSVADGGTITAEYIDEDDGIGGINVLRSATAGVDCAPPVISAVQAVDVTGMSARVTWATNENSTSQVNYGTTPPPGSSAATAGLATVHSVQLNALAECTPYVYSVTSADGSGNTATDTNAGAYYAFMTGKNTNPSYPSTDTPIQIPDNNSTGITSTINVPDAKTVLDVNVTVNITHTFTGDLELRLIGPNNAVIFLSDNRGSSGQNFVNTVFDDEAATAISSGAAPFTGSFRPETPLSVLDGIQANGAWKLRVVDNAGQDVGPLNNWTLTLTFPNQACGPHAKYESHTNVSDTCASGGAGGNNVWDAGETVSFSVKLTNDGTDPLTGISATVTPTTAGVLMANGTQGYPNLAAGAQSDSNAPHFTAVLPEGLTCASNVGFDVVINTTQGTWNGSFTHVCGQPVSGSGTLLNENFSGGIPAGWTIVDGGAGGGASATWMILNPEARPIAAPMSAPVANVDSDNAGTSATQDEQLITPVLNLTGATGATLQFDQFFRWYVNGLNEVADVDIRSANTGGAWVNLLRQQGASSPEPDHKSIDITAQAAGAADVQIRFHYYTGQFEWYWQIDNVRVDFTSPGGCNMTVCSAPGGVVKPVADGSFGTAMTASRKNAAGTTIDLTWDVATCSSTDHEVIYGDLATVSSYSVGGSYCALGTSGASTWSAAPVSNLWFVVVGNSGAGIEGSWGKNSAGAERNGGTVSGQCGNASRDNTGTCP